MINADELPPRTVIKIIGLGGGGSNAVNRMMQVGIPGIDYIAANTDIQALACSEAPVKIQLGLVTTHGMGAGGKPSVGRRAAEESYTALVRALTGADMVFLTAGMGGGTGTGAIPVAARAAREVGAITLAVVTMPFGFEGATRERNAKEGIVQLREQVHTLITVPNDRLLQIVPRNMPLDVAFRVADDVLRQGVQGIAELVAQSGIINLDFANVRRLVQMSGGAVLALGQGEGANKAVQAARRALEHHQREVGAVAHAAGVLNHITGGPDLSLWEMQTAVDLIRAEASPDAEIVFGASVNEMMTDRAQVILVATGVGARSLSEVFGEEAAKAIARRRPPVPEPAPSEPAQVGEVEAEDAFEGWSVAGAQRAAARRDSLDVPAFLRRRLMSSTQAAPPALKPDPGA